MVTRSEVDNWAVGETSVEETQVCLDKAHDRPVPFKTFVPGDIIPSGALVATDFLGGNVHWTKLPVKKICTSGNWGLFESTESFQAPSEGAYWVIVE